MQYNINLTKNYEGNITIPLHENTTPVLNNMNIRPSLLINRSNTSTPCTTQMLTQMIHSSDNQNSKTNFVRYMKSK